MEKRAYNKAYYLACKNGTTMEKKPKKQTKESEYNKEYYEKDFKKERKKKRTYEEALQYSRDYYNKNKEKIKEKHYKYNKKSSDKHRIDGVVLDPKSKKPIKKQNLLKERKLQDKITYYWRLYGIFMMPDEEEIEEEIIKEILLEDDSTIEDVEIEDCLLEDEDNDEDELKDNEEYE